MAHPQLDATTRTERGNGPARRLRRQGRALGVVYQPPGDSLAISMSEHDLRYALHQEGGLGVVELSIDGGPRRTVVLVDRDRDPVRGEYWHVDFRVADAAAIAHAEELLHEAELEAEARAELAAHEPEFVEPEPGAEDEAVAEDADEE